VKEGTTSPLLQKGGEAPPDKLGHLPWGEGSVYHQEALGLLARQGEEALAHTSMEIELLTANAVAMGLAGQGGRWLHVQKDRKVGGEAMACHLAYLPHHL